MTKPRKAGRPRSGVEPIRSTLAIRLTPALRAALDARAERDETSIGAVVRAAIEAYVGGIDSRIRTR